MRVLCADSYPIHYGEVPFVHRGQVTEKTSHAWVRVLFHRIEQLGSIRRELASRLLLTASPNPAGGDTDATHDRPPHGPGLLSTNQVHPNVPPRQIRSSWAKIIGSPHTLCTDESDVVYKLYQECLRYLERKHPVGSWVNTTAKDIRNLRKAERHPPFTTLANALADRYPSAGIEELKQIILVCQSSPPCELHDTLGFIFYGAVAVLDSVENANALGSPAGNLAESDLYQALFLHLVGYWWMEECMGRSREEWSPMPWSQASRGELSDSQTAPRESVMGIDPLRDEDVDALLPVFLDVAKDLYMVYPINIPWPNGPHDGHLLCNTLSGYTEIRRSGAIQSYQDDFALWVSAMTLGVLEAATRMPLSESAFLITTARNGELSLSGDRISAFLAFWVYQVRSQVPEDVRFDLARGAARVLDGALRALHEELMTRAMIQRVSRSEDQFSEAMDVCSPIALTLLPLAQLLPHIVMDAALPELEELQGRVATMFPFHVGVWGGKIMAHAGWCPLQISRLTSLGFLAQSLASSVIRLRPFIRSTSDEHKDCSGSACKLYTITDTDAYVARHVHPTCRCECIKPALHRVTSLLSQGTVPVIVYDGKELLVQPADQGPYVAISHVWADGMGSTTEDGLPTCVVERIAGLVRRLLPGTAAFWMDSLCVPGVGVLRKRAIKLMAKTYLDAAKVLVIDNCIRAECLRSQPWIETLVRLATSGWMQRVWTLQEAMLARELYFEFVDGPVDVDAQLKRATVGPAAHSYKNLVPLIGSRADSQHVGRRVPFGRVIELLAGRTTTKPQDEIVAISSLLPLKLDMDAFLNIDGADASELRMRMFLVELRDVPRDLPTRGPDLERLTLTGFSWAPRTLAAWGSFDADRGLGVCTGEGLFAEYWIGILEQPLRAAHPTDHETTVYVGYCFSDDKEDEAATEVYLPGVQSSVLEYMDALLFLEEGELLRAVPHCVGACRVVHQEPGSGAREEYSGVAPSSDPEQLPMRLRFATPSFPLHRIPRAGGYLPEGTAGTRIALGRLHKVPVQLI